MVQVGDGGSDRLAKPKAPQASRPRTILSAPDPFDDVAAPRLRRAAARHVAATAARAAERSAGARPPAVLIGRSGAAIAVDGGPRADGEPSVEPVRRAESPRAIRADAPPIGDASLEGSLRDQEPIESHDADAAPARLDKASDRLVEPAENLADGAPEGSMRRKRTNSRHAAGVKLLRNEIVENDRPAVAAPPQTDGAPDDLSARSVQTRSGRDELGLAGSASAAVVGPAAPAPQPDEGPRSNAETGSDPKGSEASVVPPTPAIALREGPGAHAVSAEVRSARSLRRAVALGVALAAAIIGLAVLFRPAPAATGAEGGVPTAIGSGPIPGPPGPGDLNGIATPVSAAAVRVRVGPGLTEARRRTLLGAIAAAGYAEPEVLLMPFPIDRDRVEFFRAEDRQAAEAAARGLASLVSGRIEVRDLGDAAVTATPGRIEVWIAD